MGIDADFRFHVPVDADFPDDVVLQRDAGEFRTYTHPAILSETEKDVERLTAELELEREDCERLRAGNGELWKQQCETAKENELLTVEVSRLQTIANCARDFIKQYKLVMQSDEFKGIWTYLHVHGIKYKGPIFRNPEYLVAALEPGSGSKAPHIIEHSGPQVGAWWECSECGDELIDVSDGEGGSAMECGTCGHEWYEGEYIEPTVDEKGQSQ